ncbi:hypothetical protein QQ020_34835 [Fulvivirgaceae bacterium BMA12]|uniref:ABC transporter permease n=1 Tax=Agaribacillus aureus TaxID=3051825 RepID=A0ABT8LHM5_9BACT|nr:hypothetical protein [Fulvivirgaceae bacterium BMA12]
MISKILKFELRARFKQPMTLLFFLMLVFQGIWYTQGSYEYYVNDATLMNGAALFYKNFAGGGIILIVIISIITGTVLYKDIQYKSAGIIYALPINEKRFFAGRFLSAFLINVILGAGIFVGMVLVPFSGIGTPDKFGPTPWGQMTHGFLLLTVSNLLMLTIVCFASLVIFKRMAAGYLSVFAYVMLFLVAETVSGNAADTTFIELIDPFAYVYTAQVLDALPADAKNTAYLPLNSIYFLNRLIWLGGSLLLFWYAYRKFSFKDFIGAISLRGRKKAIDSSTPVSKKEIAVPHVRLIFSAIEYIRKFWRLSVLEFRNVVRPVNFKIIVGILGLMFFLQNIMWNATYYLGPQQPLTSSMTLARLTMGAFIMMLLMIWAGELFFKDKTANIWQITDALPVPVWVGQLSKFVAMCGVALIMALTIIVCGVLAQILMGGWKEIDPGLYAGDLLGYKWGWLTYILNIALVFFLAGLTGHRFLTHILGVGYYFFNIISFDMGIMEELRFGYALTPGIEDFSEMNGYGIWSIASFWYFIMWATLAVVFVLLGIHFWRRGASLSFVKKLTFQTNQINWYGKFVVLICLIGFFFLQSFIVREVNDKGNFETDAMANLKDATYEQKYKWIEEIPQPVITGIDLSLDLFPEIRKATYQADMQLTNLHSVSIDTLYLNTAEFVDIKDILWNGESVGVAWEDKEMDIVAVAYRLDSLERVNITIKAEKCYDGFTQSDAQPDLAFNGLFMDARDILPTIGYHADRELNKNRDRVDQGLGKINSRMAPVEDSIRLWQDAFSPDALWLGGKIRVSTSEGQTVVAPGVLKHSSKQGHRNYFEYELEAASPFEWYFCSGSFEKIEFQVKTIKVGIFHKKEHTFNLPLYQKSIQSSIDFINEELGTYPFSEVRLVEIPFYQNEHYTFPNGIAISEKEGWIADSSGIEEKAYIMFSTATQLMRHWLYQRVLIGNVQGADILKVALPEALALQVVRQTYGEEAVDGLLQKKKDAYGKERGNEPNVEPPLIYADGVDYLEKNKGTVAIYALSQKLGHQAFNREMLQVIDKFDRQAMSFSTLYNHLKTRLPADLVDQVAYDFEKVK